MTDTFKIARGADAMSNAELLELYGRYFKGRGGTKETFTEYLLEVFLPIWKEDTAVGPIAWDASQSGQSQFFPTALVLRDLFGGFLVRMCAADHTSRYVVCVRSPILDMRPLFIWPLPFVVGGAMRITPMAEDDPDFTDEVRNKYRMLRNRLIRALNERVAPRRD